MNTIQAALTNHSHPTLITISAALNFIPFIPQDRILSNRMCRFNPLE